jgi:Zn-dependent peptidase ImmA (M78 family)
MNVVRTLRDMVPIRPLMPAEAKQIAEQQALRLLELSGVKEPPVPERVIATLPRIQVERMTPSLASGASQWSRGRWLILIHGGQPLGRQRFTLGHELKHILDHPFIDVLYPTLGSWTAAERRETICNHFAGNLLMPRPWVTRAWREGVQDVPSLAAEFEVSRQAMEVRLQQLGLTKPLPRCRSMANMTRGNL